MAKTSSAKKALRAEARRRVFNIRRAKGLKDALKNFDSEKSSAKLPAAYKAIDKALKRGIIKRNTAARMKSKVARAAK